MLIALAATILQVYWFFCLNRLLKLCTGLYTKTFTIFSFYNADDILQISFSGFTNLVFKYHIAALFTHKS